MKNVWGKVVNNTPKSKGLRTTSLITPSRGQWHWKLMQGFALLDSGMERTQKLAREKVRDAKVGIRGEQV